MTLRLGNRAGRRKGKKNEDQAVRFESGNRLRDGHRSRTTCQVITACMLQQLTVPATSTYASPFPLFPSSVLPPLPCRGKQI